MFDIYAAVSDRIISQLEQGIIPWHRPWIVTGGAVNHKTGAAYSLLNQILLGEPGEYVTYKVAQELGGQVRKGEKGKVVVFWSFIPKKEDGKIVTDEDGNTVTIPMLKYYTVFNINQCDGLSPRWTNRKPVDKVQSAEEVVENYLSLSGVTVRYGSDSAYYSPSRDLVAVPSVEQYSSTAEYYSTLFHELTHSTGHPKRLNRISETAFFGSTDYSKEELVAEIGAFGILSILGIDAESAVRNNAAYIQSWLKALNNDKKMIVSACGKAEKAINMILNKISQKPCESIDK